MYQYNAPISVLGKETFYFSSEYWEKNLMLFYNKKIVNKLHV